MSGAMNKLMSGYWGDQPATPQVDDWTMRLPTRPDRPWQPDVDHPMIVQPFVDPGYRMPNPPMENLNSMQGAEVSGWLPANVTQSQVPDPRVDPAGYQNWLRVMRARGAI